jgi:hypothetical protein
VYALADLWVVEKLKAELYPKALTATCDDLEAKYAENMVPPEEIWSDLFIAIEEAYNLPEYAASARKFLLAMVAENSQRARTDASFTSRYLDTVADLPRFGLDMMMFMGSGRSDSNSLHKFVECLDCEETFVFFPGTSGTKQKPRVCPFCRSKFLRL